MEVVFTVLAYAGLLVVITQSWPYFSNHIPAKSILPVAEQPLVSIIIPARNEENSLPKLLASLLESEYTTYEILVVDDHSEDLTYEVASKFAVTVIKAPPKPEDWVGKSWACYIGSCFAKGELFLFTDADTVHTQSGLKEAVAHLRSSKAVLLSAPSFHQNNHWWEKLLGPFHFLVTMAATPFNKPNLENPYAIGQYLLFDAVFYQSLGGHTAISSSLGEDVDLARMTITNGGLYQLHTHTRLYEVQMYKGFGEFLSGWSRLLRVGMQSMEISSMIISTLAIFALLAIFHESGDIIYWVPTLLTLICIWHVQQFTGNFSIWGIVFFPLGLGLFILLGTWAAISQVLHLPLQWRGRTYTQPGNV
jgi:cellulose synthase/poly-beta-1,6-N-acetylglucosamine synthase-like glycosyltransferase